MKNLYANFDALYVAFQGALPRVNRERFAEVKARAGETGKPERLRIGHVTGHVKATGAQGGYAFVFDMGDLKHRLLFKDNGKPDEWNIFAQVSSESLIANGLDGAKKKLFADLNALGIKIAGHSINRVDFACDFESDSFKLCPENFVAHHASTAKRHYEKTETKDLDDDNLSIVGLSDVTSVTIGSMPNRQIIVYNKLKEARKKQKFHWFEVWGVDKKHEKNIWRVEVRAGKHHLKSWNINTFADLEECAGDMFIEAFEKIKYVETREVSNISRAVLHELWLDVVDIITNKLWDYIAGVTRGRIREVKRHEYREMIDAQDIGLIATSIATVKTELSGDKFKRFILAKHNQRLSTYLDREWPEFCDKVARAKDRLIFLDDLETTEQTA